MDEYVETYGQDYFDNYNLYTGDLVRYSHSDVLRNHLYKLGEAIIERVDFKTHLDVGCAAGYLVECMLDNHKISYGIDVSPYIVSNAAPKIADHLYVHNIVNPMTNPPQVDLVTCIEVFEHLNPVHTKYAVQNILDTNLRWLYFSSAHDKTEQTHINARSRSEWIILFRDFGFIPVSFIENPIPWGILLENTRR